MNIERADSICIMGLANCDSVRKARRWLDEHKIDHDFRDFRKTPLNHEEVAGLLQPAGPEQLVNRRSASWRSLSEEDQAIFQTALNETDVAFSATGSMVKLIQANQTMIKRPVLIADKRTLCGFNEADWSDALGI